MRRLASNPEVKEPVGVYMVIAAPEV